MKKIKLILLILILILTSIVFFAGCKQKEELPQKEETIRNEPEKISIHMAVLKGPTGIGAAELMQQNEEKNSLNDYEFTVAAAPEEIVSKIVSGEVDIAAVPTNMASTLYNKTEGKVKIAAINTLGVLYLLENGDEVQSFEDLSGKTLYISGKGATPEYIMDYLLKANNIQDVTVEFKTTHEELAAALASNQVGIGVLPEPQVTAVTSKSPNTRIALDITQEWALTSQKLQKEESQLAMGCIVVREDFLKENKEAFDDFLKEYKQSIDFTNQNQKEAAVLVEKFEIIPSAQVAEKAIPNCNIVYIDEEQMKNSLTDFYSVLFEANPQSIGGKLPDEDFYYSK